jgi:hypothetical protein
MRKRTKWIVGGVAVAAVLGGIVYYEKNKTAAAAVPSSLPAGSVTPVTTFTKGQKYTFAAPLTADANGNLVVFDANNNPVILTASTGSGALVANLQALGWANVVVPFFMGQGSAPAGFPAVAANGYIATGTWTGASGTPVPTGVLAAATP